MFLVDTGPSKMIWSLGGGCQRPFNHLRGAQPMRARVTRPDRRLGRGSVAPQSIWGGICSAGQRQQAVVGVKTRPTVVRCDHRGPAHNSCDQVARGVQLIRRKHETDQTGLMYRTGVPTTDRVPVPLLMRMASHPLRWALLTELACSDRRVR